MENRTTLYGSVTKVPFLPSGRISFAPAQPSNAFQLRPPSTLIFESEQCADELLAGGH